MAIPFAFHRGKVEPRTIMSADGGNHPNNMDPNDPVKRSERKRQREKQRRSDLSNAFDDLAAFMNHVEPEDDDADPDGKRRKKKFGDGDEAGGATRLDLIGRALKLMKRLHAENEERKGYIAGMRDTGRGDPGMHGGNDNVLVMVPTLTPVEEGYVSVARASYPSFPPNYYQHQPQHGTVVAPPHHASPPPTEYMMAVPHGRPQPPHFQHASPQQPPPHYHNMPPQHYQHSSWGQPSYGVPISSAQTRGGPAPTSQHPRAAGSDERRPSTDSRPESGASLRMGESNR